MYMPKWTKRKLFTFAFKGRERRALLWRKDVYAEWFEYAKIAQQQGLTVPISFGDLSSFGNFEEWWKDPMYGFELFCEPVLNNAVTVLDSPPTFVAKNHTLLDIDLNMDQDKLIDLVTRSIKQKQGKQVEYESQALFQPRKEMKRIKTEHLKLCRKTWLLIHSGMKHVDVVKEMGCISKNIKPDNELYEQFMLSGLRRVSRYKRAVNMTLDNITKGIFP